MWLDNLLEDFIIYLQNKNFIIPPENKILLVKAIKSIDITDKKQVFALTYSIIVKNKNELKIFTEIFSTFFDNLNSKNNINYTSPKNLTENNSILDSVLSSYKLNKYTYNSRVKAFILNDENRLDRLIRLAVSNLNEININNFGLSFNQVKNTLNINQLEEDIKIIEKELKKHATNEEVEEIINKIMLKLKNFKKNIRIAVKTNAINNKNTHLEIDFNNNEKIYWPSIETSAKKLIEKLKKKKSKRFKKSQRGILNIYKTLNKSVAYNHIPLKRYYKKKKLKKRELIIVADISDSVRKYSKMMLYYIYSLNTFFKEIKTFTFISEIKEITQNFNENKSFESIMTESLNEGGNSDYNSSFESFAKKHHSYFNKNVILIIIGDARNNYIPADLKNIIEIQKKVREIVWLNPDNKLFWNTTDSNMEDYQRIISSTFQIKTIKDIEKFSESIIFR